MDKNLLYEELKTCLTKDLIPFWKGLIDRENGGFYGFMDNDGNIDKKALKGGILNSRILWFFSKAYIVLLDDSLREYMDSSYNLLIDKFFDEKYGGIYWSLDHEGNVLDDSKHTYNQAFAIYGLCAYYEATKNINALNAAKKLFDLIEAKMRDKGGYLEAFERDFSPTSNEKLSENGVVATRTMNTLLHIMEAYTELYRMSGEDKVYTSLKEILMIIREKIYNPALKRQEVFFDNDYRSLIDLYSYGHDIESAWLINRTIDVLKDKEIADKMMPIVDALTSEVYKQAYKEGSIPAECEDGKVDEKRIWWVQAESMTGFYNGYENDDSRNDYLDATFEIWEYIKKNLINNNVSPKEWYWYVEKDGTPSLDMPMVEPWKCPYHNGRMCMELMQRTKKK